MVLSINNIKSKKGAVKKRKRIGRGNAAGQGTYCGKGLKGQKARSGVSNLKRLGMKQVLLRTPKKRGFTSLKPKSQIVNLIEINKHFKGKDIVNPQTLLKKGLIDNIKLKVKILGTGKLKENNLQFNNVLMSESVKKQINKTGKSEKKDNNKKN
ncbi:50S ribosomal protein L15 [Candidatus Falkowbacteria bacterium]|nr:MAG: 50S ribosomal protein L15 [Candidatus Falkowbacteria bacterium]